MHFWLVLVFSLPVSSYTFFCYLAIHPSRVVKRILLYHSTQQKSKWTEQQIPNRTERTRNQPNPTIPYVVIFCLDNELCDWNQNKILFKFPFGWRFGKSSFVHRELMVFLLLLVYFQLIRFSFRFWFTVLWYGTKWWRRESSRKHLCFKGIQPEQCRARQ